MSPSNELVEFAPSHLRVADIAFQALVAEPRRLTLDCSSVGGVPGPEVGLPAGEVELPWLRDWLLEHRDNYPARDAVWRELIGRARALGGEWRIVAVAMAMPALIRLAGGLARDYRGDPADVDNEILTGFLEALERRVDLGGSRLYAKLCWAGFRAGYAARYADSAVVLIEDLDTDCSIAPHLPYGHPDLLLARAVAIGLIDADDADLITATWLEHKTIEQVSRRTGADPGVLRMRRLRAGRRLADAILDGLLSGAVSEAAKARLKTHAAIRAALRSTPAADQVADNVAAQAVPAAA
jgi:hypothetical protein